ncbi:uncharacterized protein EI97DRAFT_53987 [Westerdykella ornata]|uniref:Uncharacterized protein n=1 Tax=Westerdykella ornata TaxID=318751 RepID=A0A6A6JKQ9_WESOR|nr:uncharacterized protein EI97DRAFT_53987 [Westerdykella ornata]KAF2276276.1 hypothetical protein EI97DRAFT_53987 [Westerdykella ornata]
MANNNIISNSTTSSDPVSVPVGTVSSCPVSLTTSRGISVQSPSTIPQNDLNHIPNEDGEKSKIDDSKFAPSASTHAQTQESFHSDQWHTVPRTWTSIPRLDQNCAITESYSFPPSATPTPSPNSKRLHSRALSDDHAPSQPPPVRPETARRLTLESLQQLNCVGRERDGLSAWLREDQREGVWDNIGYVRVPMESPSEGWERKGGM